jgi:hypothetical protein
MQRLLMADFETKTTKPTSVWAFGITEIGNTDFFIYGDTITEFMYYLEYSDNAKVYFHNLAFDGEFIFIYLFTHGFTHVIDKKDFASKTFTTLISDKGQFYSIKIIFEKKGKIMNSVTIYDSYKILPFSVPEIAGAFDLPITKGDIDYTAHDLEDHPITPLELDYLKRDVLIPAMALYILFTQGLDEMTQGSNALHDFKNILTPKEFNRLFPIPLYDADVRQSYKGGFTYLNPKFKNKDIGSGIVLDVNSLYPSVMNYKLLPYGEPLFFEGKYIIDDLYPLYVQMFTCQFELKKDHIPTIQLKNNLSFMPTEYVTTSKDEEVTLCLTSIDLELFFEHYDVYNITYHSGWKFKATIGIFKEYIDKWIKIKIESTLNGNKAMRTLAKLMLNALYGKFGLNPRVQSKIPYYVNGVIKYGLGDEDYRDPIYIPVATFITSHARSITIRAAQKVFDRFIYADTDSLHLEGLDEPIGIDISDTDLGLWKHEFTFTRGRYLRQKTYMEYGREPKEEKQGKPEYWKITVAGMPDECKNYVTWDNFKIGSSYPGKLQKKHVTGGIILEEQPFTIKP